MQWRRGEERARSIPRGLHPDTQQQKRAEPDNDRRARFAKRLCETIRELITKCRIMFLRGRQPRSDRSASRQSACGIGRCGLFRLPIRARRERHAAQDLAEAGSANQREALT